jgi:hypothetical protein
MSKGALVLMALSTFACLSFAFLKLKNVYAADLLLGCGAGAGVFQWFHESKRKGSWRLWHLPIQIYGMVILVALPSAAALITGRLIAGTPWNTG